MTRSTIAWLQDHLTERDLQLLQDIEQYRLLTTKQIQRLHFDPCHPTTEAATRACNRALQRLRAQRLVTTLERRIGGVRSGSAGYVWYLGPAGDRLLRSLSRQSGGRRNYREPSRHFVEHTLAVAELAVRTTEASRRDTRLDVAQIDSEPRSWQQSLSAHGTTQWLKPDLRLVTHTPDDELHYFVEADQGSEHLPVIARQCAAYASFYRSGRYQAAHGIFPSIVWVAPTDQRALAIQRTARAALATSGVSVELFRSCTTSSFITLIRSDAAPDQRRLDDAANSDTPGEARP